MQSINIGAQPEAPNGQTVTQGFGHILSNGLPSLYRLAYRLLGNAADAEDAVQDALLSAYMHLDQFRGEAKISTWLATIVHNSARMQLRKRPQQIHVSLDEPIGEDEERSFSHRLADRRPSPEDECRNAELSRFLADFQTQLTPKLRKTFQLRDLEGLSIGEAARILKVPDGTVKARSARARRKLVQSARRALKFQPQKFPETNPRGSRAAMCPPLCQPTRPLPAFSGD
jgi:RNA polymerase sigma-70 factor, ECF subfamily